MAQISQAIYCPQFYNLKLYDIGYKVTISFHISKSIYDMLVRDIENNTLVGYTAIKYGVNKYYIHYEKSYDYTTPFQTAYSKADCAKKDMMCIIRKAKIRLLTSEIEYLEWE